MNIEMFLLFLACMLIAFAGFVVNGMGENGQTKQLGGMILMIGILFGIVTICMALFNTALC